MLQTLSDGLRNSKILAGVVIAIIVIPFALWGIGSYVRGGGNTFAASVNDVEISPSELERAYVEQRNRLQEMFGGRLPAQFADGAAIRQQALDSLINRELLFQVAREEGYAISDTTLAQALLEIDAFKQDGRFDQQRYEMQLRSQGLSPSDFERSAKSSMVIDQMRRGLSNSDFVLRKESLQVQALREQKRSLQFVNLPLDPLKQTQEVSDEEIARYYEDNKNRFAELAKVKVEYLELDEQALADQVVVTDEEIAQTFESRAGQFTTPEEREAAHILITLPDDASAEVVAEKREEIEKLRQQIMDGADFEAVAREHSEDPGSASDGGNLGSVSPGLMVPEFEQALFEIENVGDVSQPVRTDFGFHLIKLLGMVPSTQRELEEVAGEIEEEIKQQRAESLFFDRAELLGNASYENPDSLKPAAELTGLSVETSDWIDMASSEGLARFPSFRTAALSERAINERRNSDLVELGNNHVVVFRVVDHQPSTPKPLEAVRDDIRDLLKSQKASQQLAAQADEVAEALRQGRDPQEVAKEFGGEWVDRGDVVRNAGEVDRNLLTTLFSLPKPGDSPSIGTSRLQDGDMAVIVMSSVDTPTGQTSTDPTVDQAIERARGNRIFEAWLLNQRANADIRIANSALE